MIDFTDLSTKRKTYAGANGSKICVLYENTPYMLKFPAVPSRNKEMSYANGCVSEYLGCHIFEIAGIPVQETLLGIYRMGDKEKIVVACRDFTANGLVLQDFASLKNTIIDSAHNGYGTELDDIEQTMEEQTSINPQCLKERFWDMFIVDALIGNWDRHNGNWGFLYDAMSDELFLAPVYDCGSCLFPQANEAIMMRVLSDQNECNQRVFNIPLSSIKRDGKKLQYFSFISSLENAGCNQALRRIVPRLDMEQINALIEDTPFLTDLQRKFYKTMLRERKERILDFSYEKLIKRDRIRAQER